EHMRVIESHDARHRSDPRNYRGRALNGAARRMTDAVPVIPARAVPELALHVAGLAASIQIEPIARAGRSDGRRAQAAAQVLPVVPSLLAAKREGAVRREVDRVASRLERKMLEHVGEEALEAVVTPSQPLVDLGECVASGRQNLLPGVAELVAQPVE